MPLKQWIKRQVRKVIPKPHPPAPEPVEVVTLPKYQNPTRGADEPHSVSHVIGHYETFAPVYREVYGDVYQAARPYDIEELLRQELATAQLKDGQRVLDAGCGVCGPAIYFAQQKQITVDAVTISPSQLTASNESVAKAKLSSRIKVHLGDYHKLEELFPVATFDRVYFLEALCHAEDYRRALTSAWKVLKPGGCLYIKDYLKLDLSADLPLQERQEKFLNRAYAEYHFKLIDEKEMLSLLDAIGFELEFLEDFPFKADKEDLAVQVNFELKVDFHWREGLDLIPIKSVEIRARKR